MCYAMKRELQASHYAVQQLTSYNGADLPFAYPPLGFYASGWLADASGMSLLTVFRVLPLLISTLAIGAFFLVARGIFDDRRTVTAAVFAFALIPRSFNWMIVGCGVTRSFG